MLLNLTINNIVLIDHLDLEVSVGFTALTGETGAGKSIVLDALGLALGGKSDLDLIRRTASTASVIAHFSLDLFPKDHAVFDLLAEHDLIDKDMPSEVILKRTLSQEQKGRCFINDQPISLPLLRQFGEQLLHVHGQHDHLLNESLHKVMLDNYAALIFSEFKNKKDLLHAAYQHYIASSKDLIAFEERLIEQRKKMAFYEQVQKDLKGVRLGLGLEDQLLEEYDSLQHIGKAIGAVDSALKSLESPSLTSFLYNLKKSLEKVDTAAMPALQNAIGALDRAGIEISEAIADLESLYKAEQTAAQDLESIQEHLHLIRGLARKYYTTTDGLCDLLMEAENAHQSAEHIEDQRIALTSIVKEALKEYKAAEQSVFDLRLKAGEDLAKDVLKELPDLKLEQADFIVHLERPDQEHPLDDGGHKIAFWVSMNKGQTLAPLVKSASGGEMARLMLVLKMIIARTTNLPTLIFDEIDTGVGGAVATAIGHKLKSLGASVQIIAITHSPQVAAAAHHQWKIAKTTMDDHTTTHVTVLDDTERLHEIARMLSGKEITEEAKHAAKVLLHR